MNLYLDDFVNKTNPEASEDFYLLIPCPCGTGAPKYDDKCPHCGGSGWLQYEMHDIMVIQR